MNRRLLIATPLYPPEIGGPATYTRILEEELPKYGYHVEIEKFSEVKHLPRGVRHIAYFGNLLLALFRNDAIFALDPVSVGLPALLASRVLLKPLYVKVVGDYAWEQFQIKNEKVKGKNFVTPEEFQKGRYDFLTEVRRWVSHYVTRSARAVIVPSNYLKKIVIAWGVPGNVIHVIYNSFKNPIIGETRDALRERLHFSGPVVLSAGRLVPWKGFAKLVESVPALLSEFPTLKLLIIGTGPEQTRILRSIEKYNLATSVTLLDSLPHKELMEHLKASDAFVLNTGYEGLSHILLEARSLGVPIVTTNVGGNPEVVEDGKEGILIPFNDHEAIAKSLREVLSRRFTIHPSSGKDSFFSVERMVKECVRLLESNA